MASKVVQDPVHGAVSVDGVFLEILDRPEMQRLRRVKQLGLGCLVFPGANHTRFEHCLGTYHLAGRMSEVLGMDRESSDAVRMAGLLHDVCHPPYSHALEGLMERAYGMDHMETARALVFGDIPFFREEDSDIFGGTDTMAEVMEAAGISPGEVCDLISCPVTPSSAPLDSWDGYDHFPSRDYAHQIIHGPVDADQMDYLMRDSLHTGVCHGRIDVDRLLKTMEVVNDRIAVRRGGIPAAEGLMVSRSLMYTSVYFHEAVRIAQRMASKAAEESRVDLSDLHLLGDSELMERVRSCGGRPSLEVRRISSRILDKKALAVHGDQATEDLRDVLKAYAAPGGAARLEREVADAAGADVMDVCAEVTTSSNLSGMLSIGKTDVSVSDGSGRVRSLTRYSPVSRALQARDPYGWAAIVAAPEPLVERVGKAARRVLGLRPSPPNPIRARSPRGRSSRTPLRRGSCASWRRISDRASRRISGRRRWPR